ncbi:MAG: enoyl-CoA hydratase/carnithine racemase [Mycobacterium sp.]|nr:enoyl-CoA hydratase/carnithine racemase [Mycobacterium sp.]
MTLNRPERMNSMAFDVMVPLKGVLDDLTYDNTVRAVVLTGAGCGFSSGADHKSAGAVPHVDGLTRPTYALRSMELLDDVILGLRRLHQPVIAAVNGAAIGGGLCLALAADIRIASTDAYFRAAGINNGLTASELGLSYLLPRAIGSSRAFEIMLTGRDVDADEAERIGLVSRQVAGEDLLETCFELAERHRRVLPSRRRVDQAHTVERTGRRYPGGAYAGRRARTALRAPAHRQLRRGRCGARRAPARGVPGRALRPPLTTSRQPTGATA